MQFGGHNSGFTGTLADLTDKNGRYKIHHVFPGTYPKIAAIGAGYDLVVKSATIVSHHGKKGENELDFALRRDWAALSGGGSIADFNGPDFTGFGCGPESAIDQSESNGWGSTTDGDDGACHRPRDSEVRGREAAARCERVGDPGQPVEHLR